MQTPKTRAGTLEVPQRSTKTARQLKTSGAEPDSSSSQSPAANRTPKARSPKVVNHRSPRTPTFEKKRPGRVSELETQLANLQEELKKTKDQLNQSELCKKRAHEDAEEAKKQLAEMSEKLQDSEKQLDEISASEESRLQELRKVSQDRDKAWESELEAVQKHHSVDSAALLSAMNEVQKLKNQLEKVAESEANQAKYAESAHNEMLSLRMELSETLAIVEELKNQLNDTKDSEARALEIASQTQEKLEAVKSTEETLRMELSETLAIVEELKYQLNDSKDSEARALEIASQTHEQLEAVKSTEETLRLEKLKAVEDYVSLTLELEKSKAQVNSLEGIVCKLQVNNDNSERDVNDGDREELNCVKMEVEKLRGELEGAEKRYQEEYIQSMLHIRSAYELVEQTRSESCEKVAILEAELEKSKAEFEDLNSKLLEKEAKLQYISEENNNLNEKLEKTELTTKKEKDTEDVTEVTKLEAHLEELKLVISEKETELKNITEENERLKMEKNLVNGEAVASAEAARVAEKEAVMKVGYLTEEAEKNGRKVERVTEQLDLAQAANAEMEAELRRLKVQSDQWRKAAEAAAAMLSGNNNGKYVERTGSLDSHTIGGKLNSPFSEDMEDESPKKKNGNMLKKIGVLLKKSQK